MKYPTSFSSIARRLLAAYGQERMLLWLGLLGIGLGVVGSVVMAVRGRMIPPEGDLFKAVSFDVAVGIYILTITLFTPLAGFSPRGLRRWRRWSIALVLYTYGIENVQIYRGIDPRFTRVGSTADEIAGLVFSGVAVSLIVMFLIFTRQFFTKRNKVGDDLLLLGIRYGCVATIYALAAGVWMNAIAGARVGANGSVLPLHAMGFHGLQAVPLVALLFSWSSIRPEVAARWVHAAGLTWLGAMTAITWQTAEGRSVLEPSPLIWLASFLMVIWLLCAARAAISCARVNFPRRHAAPFRS